MFRERRALARLFRLNRVAAQGSAVLAPIEGARGGFGAGGDGQGGTAQAEYGEDERGEKEFRP